MGIIATHKMGRYSDDCLAPNGIFAHMHKPAIEHLGKSDPVMRRIIERIGPCEFVPQGRRSPFESLARAIAHQQLNGKAAESILRRFIALFPKRRFPKPDDLSAVTDEIIR